jgi:6-pyruvoyltetrahydropterin/6-carboxytetrahydropterin synthase
MGTIRVTKEFTFEMAHALYGYSGACKNIHGHSYKLSVTIAGAVLNDPDSPANGMVLDFGLLKEIVQPFILHFDHATILNRNSPHKELAEGNLLFQKLVLADYQPTCENLLLHLAGEIRQKLPEHIRLHHLTLQETPTSYAEWFAEDNRI